MKNRDFFEKTPFDPLRVFSGTNDTMYQIMWYEGRSRYSVAMGSDIGHMPVQTLVDFEGLPQDAPKSSIICEGNYIIVQGKKKSSLLIVLGVVVQCARNVETWYCASRKVLI